MHRERGIIITRIAVERFRSAEIYAAVGDLISEIVKTDITIASVIINVPTAFVHDLAKRNIMQSIYVSAFIQINLVSGN